MKPAAPVTTTARPDQLPFVAATRKTLLNDPAGRGSTLPTVRVAIVSHVLPPSWSGQAMILARLLRGFSPADYVLVRTMDIPALDDAAYEEPLPAKTFRVPETFVPAGPGASWGICSAQN